MEAGIEEERPNPSPRANRLGNHQATRITARHVRIGDPSPYFADNARPKAKLCLLSTSCADVFTLKSKMNSARI
jgi:hypothetical protein